MKLPFQFRRKFVRLTATIVLIGVDMQTSALAIDRWMASTDPYGRGPNRPDVAQDFLELFNQNATWATASRKLIVLKFGPSFIDSAPEEVLRRAFADLKRRGIAIAWEMGAVSPGPNCGRGEGYAGDTARSVARIKAAGGNLAFVAMDEPFWYGHHAKAKNTCQYSIDDLALRVAERLRLVRAVFPNVQIGDIEPVGNSEVKDYPAQIAEWADAFRRENGRPLAFFHADIVWDGPWVTDLFNLKSRLAKVGVPVGVIINGDPLASTDLDWTTAALLHLQLVVDLVHFRPKTLIFQTWDDRPAMLLPDNESGSLTNLVVEGSKSAAKIFLKPTRGAIDGIVKDAAEKPIPNTGIEISVRDIAGLYGFHTANRTGTVPSDAASALFGLRVGVECNCSGPVNVSIGRSQFRDGHALPVVRSLQDGIDTYHVSGGLDTKISINSDPFPVTAGDPYVIDVPLLVMEQANSTGYLAIFFLDANGKEVRRDGIKLQAPEQPIGRAITDFTGRFSLRVPVGLDTAKMVLQVRSDSNGSARSTVTEILPRAKEMSLTQLQLDRFSSLVSEDHRRSRLTLHWEQVRVENLRLRGMSNGPADFEHSCVRGLIAAADGKLDDAESILLSTLHQFTHLYPANTHFITCVIQLALAVQALDLVAQFLNDRYDAPNFFHVNFHQSTKSRATNLVAIDKHGKCHISVDPRTPGSDRADYLVGRWLSSTPLWVSYCRGPEWEAGKALVNFDDCGDDPGFVFCGRESEGFLIPDPYFLNSRGYQDLRARYQAVRGLWASRQPVAFWRGTTTGIRTGEKNWQSLPRIRLCQISQVSPQLLDARITKVVQSWFEGDKQQIEAAGLLGAPVREEEFPQYKYQIDIDGNSNSWPGLMQKLLTGSPVLKIASPHGYRQWYYDRLKPWVNFVPVASDMSDLIEKIEWLRAHDDAARQIGERGKVLAESLDYDGELERSGRTITAAFRYFSAKPETVLRFDATRTGMSCLQDGWGEPEEAGVPTLGMESRLKLPRPVAAEDFLLLLDISPSPCVLDSSSAQRMVVVVNGEILERVAISQRHTLRCALPRRVIDRATEVNVTLLHPDGRSAASASRPLNESVLSVMLHRLELMPASIYVTPDQIDLPSIVAVPPRASRQGVVMQALYGRDIWHGFVSSRPRQTEIQGWNGRHPALRRLLAEIPNKTVIDVGVWKGQSTVYIADAMRQSAMDGCVVAVDTFLWPEHWSAEGKLFSRHPGGRSDVHETFLDNVFQAGVSDLVVPLPLSTAAAVQLLLRHGVKAGLLHLDASRDYSEALQDAEAYWSLLEPGGYLVGDDYGPGWPGVMRAAQEFAAKIGQELIIDGPKWILRKTMPIHTKHEAPKTPLPTSAS